jgi:hypothetical protein
MARPSMERQVLVTSSLVNAHACPQLSEAWWDAEENPKRGQRPTKKSKKAKDANKENTPKGTKKAKKAVTEPSSDE